MADIKLLALSGILLIGMFFVGLFSVGNVFLLIFVLHLALHFTLLWRAAKTMCQLFQKDAFSIFLGASGVLLPILTIILLSLLPITHRDALIHHIFIPKMWIQSGSIHTLSWHEWSYYPMLLQLAFTGFLKLECAPLISAYHGSYLIILANILILQSEGLPLRLRQLGVLFCFTTPLFLRLGSAPLVDLPLLLYGASVTYLLFQAKPAPSLIGVLLGLMAGIKYNGLLFCLIFLGLALPLMLFSKRWKIRHAVTTILLFTLVASPWYLRNSIETGNPIYPLFQKHFATAEKDTAAIKNHQLSPPSSQPSKDNWGVEELMLPLKMFLYGGDNDGGSFDGILTPLLLLFLLSAYPSKNPALPQRFGLIVTACYTLLALELSGPRIRYLAPILGILVWLALAGTQTLLNFVRKTSGNVVVVAFLLFQTIYGNLYGWSQLQERKAFDYLLGSPETKSTYLYRQVSESLLADAITTKLSLASKTYLLYTGNRYALYQRDVINSGFYSDKALLEWLKRNPDKEVGLFFQDLGVTHLALHKERYERAFRWYASSGLLSQGEVNTWNIFVQGHLLPVFEIGPYIVFEIRETR